MAEVTDNCYAKQVLQHQLEETEGKVWYIPWRIPSTQTKAGGIETVNRNFYMDDLLKSLPSEEDAVTMAKDLIAICSRGGFTLTQWISNSREVLRSKTLCELDLDRDKLPVDRALGL